MAPVASKVQRWSEKIIYIIFYAPVRWVTNTLTICSWSSPFVRLFNSLWPNGQNIYPPMVSRSGLEKLTLKLVFNVTSKCLWSSTTMVYILSGKLTLKEKKIKQLKDWMGHICPLDHSLPISDHCHSGEQQSYMSTKCLYRQENLNLSMDSRKSRRVHRWATHCQHCVHLSILQCLLSLNSCLFGQS